MGSSRSSLSVPGLACPCRRPFPLHSTSLLSLCFPPSQTLTVHLSEIQPFSVISHGPSPPALASPSHHSSLISQNAPTSSSQHWTPQQIVGVSITSTAWRWCHLHSTGPIRTSQPPAERDVSRRSTRSLNPLFWRKAYVICACILG